MDETPTKTPFELMRDIVMPTFAFPLRKNCSLELRLPNDLNQRDVARLHRWLLTLPIDEPSITGELPSGINASELLEAHDRLLAENALLRSQLQGAGPAAAAVSAVARLEQQKSESELIIQQLRDQLKGAEQCNDAAQPGVELASAQIQLRTPEERAALESTAAAAKAQELAQNRQRGARLKEIRAHMGLTLREFAKAMGRTSSLLAYEESDRHGCDAQTLAKAEALLAAQTPAQPPSPAPAAALPPSAPANSPTDAAPAPTEPPLNVSLGVQLKALRILRKWSQTQMAQALGVQQGRLSQIELGHVPCPEGLLIKARALVPSAEPEPAPKRMASYVPSKKPAALPLKQTFEEMLKSDPTLASKIQKVDVPRADPSGGPRQVAIAPDLTE